MEPKSEPFKEMITHFNILTRTHRSKFFKVLETNLNFQTYKNFTHIIGIDDAKYKTYTSHLSPVLLEKKVKGVDGTFPYNLYLNELYKNVKDGWILFLDDDDQFYRPDALNILRARIEDHGEDALYLWKVWFPDYKAVIPRKCFAKEPVRCDISGIGFCFHSKSIKEAQWDENKESDYRVIKKLFDYLPKTVWVDLILTELQSGQHYGS